MRVLLIAICLSWSVPAAAQTPAPAVELTQVSRLLGALWRPLPLHATADGLEAACAGAVEELADIEAALPEDATPAATMIVRAPRGFAILNAAVAGEAYFFPGPDLPGLAPGPGHFAVTDRAQGRLDLTDSAGRIFQLQLGSAAGKTMLRVLQPGGQPLTFVGCTATG